MVLGLIILTNALLPFVEFGRIYRVPDSAEGSRLAQGAAAILYAIATAALLPRLGDLLRMAKRSKLLLFLVLVALLSVVWSIDPQLSVRRALALVGTTMFAFFVALRFSVTEFIRLLGYALLVILVLSWVFVIVFPGWGIHFDRFHSGSARGVFLHKNSLGMFMALGTLAFLTLALELSRGWARAGWLTAWFFSAVMLISSTSRTGLILALTGLVSVLTLRGIRRQPSVALTGVWLACIALAIPLMMAWGSSIGDFPIDRILASVDRSERLSGRVPLWGVVGEDIRKSPWLGYGYRAYWDAPGGPAEDVHQRVGWGPRHAHNGYIDLWLDLGVLGVGAFGLCVIIIFLRVRRTFHQMRPAAAVWIPSAFLYVLLGGISESSRILQRNSITWVLFTIGYVYLFRASTLDASLDRR